jgi:hypothetical protein
MAVPTPPSLRIRLAVFVFAVVPSGGLAALLVALAVRRGVVFTEWWALVASVSCLLALVMAVDRLVRAATAPLATNATDVERRVARRRQGAKALVIGVDGRASTSKVQAVMWTFAVLGALLFLLFLGRTPNCPSAGNTSGECPVVPDEARTAFTRVLDAELQPEYVVLLGLPLAAAVAAKALVTSRVASEGLVKPEIDPSAGGVGDGLSEVVANDRGQVDLVDFQYFAFNLLMVA